MGRISYQCGKKINESSFEIQQESKKKSVKSRSSSFLGQSRYTMEKKRSKRERGTVVHEGEREKEKVEEYE